MRIYNAVGKCDLHKLFYPAGNSKYLPLLSWQQLVWCNSARCRMWPGRGASGAAAEGSAWVRARAGPAPPSRPASPPPSAPTSSRTTTSSSGWSAKASIGGSQLSSYIHIPLLLVLIHLKYKLLFYKHIRHWLMFVRCWATEKILDIDFWAVGPTLRIYLWGQPHFQAENPPTKVSAKAKKSNYRSSSKVKRSYSY